MKREKRSKRITKIRSTISSFRTILHRFQLYKVIYLVQMQTSKHRSEKEKKNLLESAKKCTTVTKIFL